MRHKGLLLLLMAALVFPSLAGEEDAVKNVIEEAYVKGIHINRDPVAIRKGFHRNFVMFVNRDGKISHVSIEDWIGRIEAGLKKNPDPPKWKTTHEFSMVNISGNAAVARVEIYRDGKHTFSDYMSLYKFEQGWKIVGKIYHVHP